MDSNLLANKPRDVEGVTYERYPVKTHLIHIKEELNPIIEKYVVPHIKPGDWIAMSEKFVTISQGRVVHESVIKPGRLAKLIVRGVTKYQHDIGYSHPRKMQVAIMQAGWFRMLFAMILGGLSRLILRRRGDFWRIAGHGVSEIDGFNPHAMAPFNEFAMLGPGDPSGTAQAIEDKYGIPTAIIDGNNINVEILGTSKGLPVDKATARLILLDNPMGQDDEMTPVILVRKA
jgi:hypothetical protein